MYVCTVPINLISVINMSQSNSLHSGTVVLSKRIYFSMRIDTGCGVLRPIVYIFLPLQGVLA